MPRVARKVFPGFPHHIVQRGNRRGQVFFNDGDCQYYLSLLRDYCLQRGVQILAYCLMTNHVHLVAVPPIGDSFKQVFNPLHARHALRINTKNGWTGHLWQGRYFSSVLDEGYFWSAMRYVELNPVRAGIVGRAQDYPWSSAGGHCGCRNDALLTADPHWLEIKGQVRNWPSWLASGESQERVDALRKNILSSWPCGSGEFFGELERIAGAPVGPRPMGRPRKKVEDVPTF